MNVTATEYSREHDSGLLKMFSPPLKAILAVLVLDIGISLFFMFHGSGNRAEMATHAKEILRSPLFVQINSCLIAGAFLLFTVMSMSKFEKGGVLQSFVNVSMVDILISISIGILFFVYSLICGKVSGSEWLYLQAPTNYHFDIYDRLTVKVFFLFSVTTLLSPISEELYFRFFLINRLNNKIGYSYAVAVSAVCFSIIHIKFLRHHDVGAFVYSFNMIVFSIISSLVILKRNNIFCGVMFHMTFNFLIFLGGVFAGAATAS